MFIGPSPVWSEKTMEKMIDRTAFAWIILWMRPANERWCYTATPSLIGWAHTQNDPCVRNKSGKIIVPVKSVASPITTMCQLLAQAIFYHLWANRPPITRMLGPKKIPDRAIWKPVVAKRNNTNPWPYSEPQILVTRDVFICTPVSVLLISAYSWTRLSILKLVQCFYNSALFW